MGCIGSFSKGTEIWIYQHPDEKEGTWQKTLVITTCPYKLDHYIAIYFDENHKYVANYATPDSWLNIQQRDGVIEWALGQGYCRIDNEYAPNYNIKI